MSHERKSSINKERVIAILKEKGISQRELCQRIVCDYSYFNRCLKNGMIGKGLFDLIAKELDVAPDYLSGEYAPDLDPDSDPVSAQLYKDLITYSNQFNRDAIKNANSIIRQVTLLSGMDKDFFDSLSEENKLELRKRIFHTISEFHFELSLIWD